MNREEYAWHLEYLRWRPEAVRQAEDARKTEALRAQVRRDTRAEGAEAEWNTCDSIGEMMRPFRVLATGRHGSPMQRKMTMLACLFARTATHLLPSELRGESEDILRQVEGWTLGKTLFMPYSLTELRDWACELRWRIEDTHGWSGAPMNASCSMMSAVLAANENVMGAATYASEAAGYAALAHAEDAPHADAAVVRRTHTLGLCNMLRSALPRPR